MISELFDLACTLVALVMIGFAIVETGPVVVGLLIDGFCWVARGIGWICGEVLWRLRRRVVGPALWDEVLSLTLEHHAAQAEIDRIATTARRRIGRIAEAGGDRPGREVQ